ncbi:hypothetical protein O0I10_008955 [Lichtheimia ornata]|uniref:Uncharacterized protein n=1 Tax=Lichtheimia ornata TaxID=688661 RepID=A0AAD7XWK2_9FUNG|nr:uncharacterized protein O0I10_008955 [Lichtheimia ornata]KAJ8655461.1 hypothetical protein O0I10_008955 [Lichtheimia ornata]
MDPNAFAPTNPADLDEWKERLLGKKYVENDEMHVEGQTFPRSQLPPVNRVLPPGAPATRDYVPNRLNVILDDADIVTSVYYA